jgi:ATP-binding cassette, subfamily B, bacterial
MTSGADAGSQPQADGLSRRLYREAKPYRMHIIGIFFLDLLATPLALLIPIPLKIAVDSVIGSEPVPGILKTLLPDVMISTQFRLLLTVAAFEILIVLLIQLQELASYVAHTYSGEKMSIGFRARLFAHSQRLSFAFHDTRGTADSVYRIQQDAAAIQYVTIDGFIPLMTAMSTLLMMVLVTALLSWQLAIVALLVAPALFYSAYTYRTRMRGRYTRAAELESDAQSVVQEVLTSLRVVKAFGREGSEHDRFLDRSSRSARARVKLSFSEGAFGLLVNLITAVGTSVVLFFGVLQVQNGALSLGELLVVMAYLAQLYGPLKTISRQFASLQFSLAGCQRAFELLDEIPEVQDKPGALSLTRAAGNVEFRDVFFSYDGRQNVLNDVSFNVGRGLRVGIAGRTGAGKTTMMSLLMRFYDPTSGAILLDGRDLRDYKLADLRNQFALVLQEPVLFSASIAENIRYARPGASVKDIEAAAAAADADDFISALPDGYNTLVGERGMRLSGGERQRISLARAFLKDAPLLILDEPTSSVDAKTEASIMAAMNRLMEDRTTFMIAHRLGTLDYCDARVEMEHGEVMLTLNAQDGRVDSLGSRYAV